MPFSHDKNGKSDLILPGSSNFRVSVDLNTELISVDKNKDFTAAPDWTAADGWALSGHTWLHTTTKVGITELTSAFMTAKSIRKGYRYSITFTVSSYSAGTLTPAIGNVLGIAIAASGTYNQIIQAAYDDVSLIFIPTSTFVGAIDDISIKCIKDLINTDANGNTISTSDNVGISTYMGSDPADSYQLETMPTHGTWTFWSASSIFRVYDANLGGWYPPLNILDGTTMFQSEAAASLTKGLLCCFNMEENAANTTVVDSTLRVGGTASTNTSNLYNAGGKLGGCFKFRGGANNDGITLTGLETTPGQYLCRGKPWSVNFWINSSSSALETLIGTTILASRPAIGINRDAADRLYILWCPYGGAYRTYATTNGLTNATWCMATVTYNGNLDVDYNVGNVKMYLNGVKETLISLYSVGTMNSTCSGNPWSIGKFAEDGTGTYDTTAYMDQVLIWNRELTAAEVALLYNSGAGLAF